MVHLFDIKIHLNKRNCLKNRQWEVKEKMTMKILISVLFLSFFMVVPARAENSQVRKERLSSVTAASMIINNSAAIFQLKEVEEWAKKHYPTSNHHRCDDEILDPDDYSLKATLFGWYLCLKYTWHNSINITLYWDGSIKVKDGNVQIYNGIWYPKLELKETKRNKE